MSNQQELICVRCGSKGTIKKIKLHDFFRPNDEVIYYCCTNCKSYGSMYESLTTNFEDFYYFLEEDWEWAPEGLLDEEVKEEDIIDISNCSEEEAREKLAKAGIRIEEEKENE
jgi:hypothetical protein